METRYVRIKGIKDALNFVEATGKVPCELTLQSGRYDIDAKSAMGIFSMDLTKIIKLEIHSEDARIIKLTDKLLKPFYNKNRK